MGQEVKQKRDESEKESLAKGSADTGTKPSEKKPAKRGWSDVFDNLTYSDGPGDNIYVFG